MATGIFQTTFPGTVQLQQKVCEADYIIGLDLHKKTTALAVIDCQTGTLILNRKRIPNSEVLTLLKKKCTGKKIVVAEAAFGWRLMRDACVSLPDTTFIPLDARKTAAWAAMSGIKNDTVDAHVLAYVCLHDGVQRLAVYQPSPENSERYKLFLHRHTLVRQRTTVKNKCKALTRDYGANPYTGEETERSGIITHIQSDLTDELAWLTERIKTIEREMVQMGKQDAVYMLLLSIPGIGPITAFALRYKMGTIERFASAKHLASYFGLGIRQKQSGEASRFGGITHRGDEHIRSLLVQGAQVIRFRKPALLSLFFPAMERTGVPTNKVVIALARKLLTFAYYCWKHQQPFDLNRYAAMRTKQKGSVRPENTVSVTIQYAAEPGVLPCPC